MINLDQKLCSFYNQNKMIIRHISIPRNSHLVPLSEPKVNEQLEESNDYASYFTKTLNPQQPIQNILSSERQGNLNLLQHSYFDSSFSREVQDKYLSKEIPQHMEDFEADLVFSPKKQIYKNRSWQIDSSCQNNAVKQLKDRFPTFNSYRPQLTNNVYLNENSPSCLPPVSINNNFYLQSKEDQSEQVIRNDHLNRTIKNRDVYRTLERFRLKNKEGQLHDSVKKLHKKYTFDPPKQNFNYPEPEITEDLDKELQRKQRKIQPLSLKNVQAYISHLSLFDRHKRSIPEDQNQQKKIDFKRQKPKSYSLRKSSQQQKTPILQPKSLIQLSSKKLKEKQVQKKTIQEEEPIKIQISYRTSLARLKEICSLKHLEKSKIIMKIPQIFAYPLLSGSETQQELFHKADQTLKHLQIAKKDISIKKYSNCIVILSGSLGIVWHYNGKVYLGGWKNHILDEGTKHGLGLEWTPKKYVYYGQFNKNKREGVGVMKTNQNQIFAGLWRDNHFIRPLYFSSNEHDDDSRKLFAP